MSVIFDHRRRHGDDEQGTSGRDENGSLWGYAYERIEGVVHLTLAFTIVGGAAVILSSALFSPGAPLGGAVEAPDSPPSQAISMSAPAPIQEAVARPAPKEAATAAAPAAQSAAATKVDPFLSARPIVESTAPAAAASAGPRPLTPPSADAREKLVARQDIAPQDIAPQDMAPQDIAPEPEASANEAAPPVATNAYRAPAAPVETAGAAPQPTPAASPETAAAEGPKADGAGHMAKCYLKLAGRVQNSGACRVDHSGQSVTFHLPGKALQIVHENGRVWAATFGGRRLGKVYRNKDAPCWGAKGFYACENG